MMAAEYKEHNDETVSWKCTTKVKKIVKGKKEMILCSGSGLASSRAKAEQAYNAHRHG